MKKFYRFKYENPIYSHNLTPRNERNAFLQNLLTILSYRNKEGERILLVEAGKNWDPQTCSLTEIFRSAMIIVEAAMEEPETQINGVRVIVDVEGFSLQHDCIPIRLKGIHIVNESYFFHMAYALFKSLLPVKLQKRLIFHGNDFEGLHNYITASVLPEKFNGDLNIPLNEGKKLHMYLEKFQAEFQEKPQYGYSEKPPKD